MVLHRIICVIVIILYFIVLTKEGKKMRKVVIALMAALFVCVGSVSEAAEVDHRSWTVVHVSYEVQDGDTLQSVAENYLKKNTYGEREINEFREGIRELNDWLLTRDMKKGDVLRINYWEKVRK